MQPQDRETLSSEQQSPSSITTSTTAQYQPISPATEKKTKLGK